MVPYLGGTGFDGRTAAVDPLHHLDLALADDLVGVASEVPLVLNEERGMAGISESGLKDEILAHRLRHLLQMLPAVDLAQNIGHARYAGLVADAHRFDLVVNTLAKFRLGEPDLEPQFLADLLDPLVEHEERGLRLLAPGLDEIDDLLVLEEIGVDVLDGFELRMGLFRGHEGIGVTAVVAVDEVDEFEVSTPLIDTQQIEVGGTDEIDGHLVPVEEAPNVRHVAQPFHPRRGLFRRCISGPDFRLLKDGTRLLGRDFGSDPTGFRFAGGSGGGGPFRRFGVHCFLSRFKFAITLGRASPSRPPAPLR